MQPTNWCNPHDESAKGSLAQLSVSSLCEEGWRPLLIGGTLRDILIRHFAGPRQPGEVLAKDLRQYVWRDDERSGILIESTTRWRGDLVNKRPAILVGRNAYQFHPLMLNDLIGSTGKGYEDYAVMWVGSHTLFCVHGTGASVDILATEVQHLFSGFARKIRERLGLLKFAVTEVGQVSKAEESRENFVVPVTIGWAYIDTWAIWDESYVLRRLPLSLLVQ